MSIMDAFRNFLPNSPAQSNQTMPGNLPRTEPVMLQNSNNGLPNPANLPVVQNQNPVIETPISPMADFAEIWKIDPPKQGAPDTGNIKFNLDPIKVAEASKSLDFTKSIPVELLAKVTAGGPDALQAVIAIANQIGQQSFAQSQVSSAKVLELALAEANSRFSANVPGIVRAQNIANTLQETNPLFSNPATAPMLELLKTQLATKFPTATPAEISDHAHKYLVGVAGEVNKLTQSQTAPAKSNEIDWLKTFS